MVNLLHLLSLLKQYLKSTLIHYRHVRIFGFASSEIVMTLMLAYFLTNKFFAHEDPCDRLKSGLGVFAALVLIAVGVHYTFGVNTELNYRLGLSCKPDFNSLTGIFPCNQ